MFDLAIIGGGPAGVAAGVYAARKRLKTIFIAEEIGGQSIVSPEVQNWIGTPKVSGPDLAKLLEAHLRAYAGDSVALHLGERVADVHKNGANFSMQTNKGVYDAQAVLIATGGSRRKLEVPGAEQFENKGLTYCASCDGPLFAGQDVVVVGGGNAGFESAAQLLAYCKSVTLVHRNADFTKADPDTVAAVLAHPNMRVFTESSPVEIRGESFVQGVLIKNEKTGAITDLPAAGVFVEIGAIPASDLVRKLVACNTFGYIIVDAKTQRSSVEGIWAAGDCSDGLYHQNNIASGDAVKALEDIFYYIKSKQGGKK